MKMLKTLCGAAAIAGLAVAAAPATEILPASPAPEWATGTWQLAGRMVHVESPYASPLEVTGNGMKLIHADGRFSMMINRPERSRERGVRLTGRGQGGNGLLADMAYGTWAIDEAARTLIFRFEMSTFPVWGREEVRVYSLNGDRWSYVDPHARDGQDNNYLEWMRLD